MKKVFLGAVGDKRDPFLAGAFWIATNPSLKGLPIKIYAEIGGLLQRPRRASKRGRRDEGAK